MLHHCNCNYCTQIHYRYCAYWHQTYEDGESTSKNYQSCSQTLRRIKIVGRVPQQFTRAALKGVWVWVRRWVWVWVCANGCAWVVVGPTVIEHAYTYVHIHKC